MHPPFQYLGYTGSVHFCINKKTYSGSLEETSDVVTYEAASLDGLRSNFEAAIDEYIHLCTEIGDDAGSEETGEGQLSIHVTDTLHGTRTAHTSLPT